MAKKSLKHQSKPANTANSKNLSMESTTDEPSAEESAPNIITATLADSPPVSISSPSSYKPITDAVSIKRLVTLAKDSPPDSALGIVWKYAYEEAYQNGRKEVLQNLGKKLEEKFKEGEKEGIKKGKEKHYRKGIVIGECEEHKRWVAAGHSQRCFAPVAFLESTGVQTDSMMSPTSLAATSQARTFVENGVDTHLTPTIAVSTQTTALTVTATLTTSISTQTDPPAAATLSISTQTNPTTVAAASQSSEPYEIRKNSKIGITSEIPPRIIVFSSKTPSISASESPTPSPITTAFETRPEITHFAQKHKKVENSSHNKNPKNTCSFSSPTPSIIVSNSTTSSTAITALETRLETTDFAQKHEKVEKSPISTKSTLEIPELSVIGPGNDATRAYASPATPYDVVSQPLTLATCASSFPVTTAKLEKRAEFGDGFNSSPSDTQPHIVAPEETVKMMSTTSYFAQNHPKTTVFNKICPKTPVSEPVNWGDEANTLPIVPTYPQYLPRDLSCLRSTTPHPFSSLQRRRSRPKKRWNTRYHHSHGHYPGYSYTNRWHHSSGPYAPSLNWDQDPRLFDLSNALRALGWVRR